VRFHSSDGYARTGTRLDGVPNPSRRVRRVVLCVGALALASLAAAWVAPRVSAGASAWLSAPPVRGAQIAVTVGSGAFFSPLTRGSHAVSAPATPAASGRLSPGWVFNMVGVVYAGPAPAGWQPPLQVRTSKDGAKWTSFGEAFFNDALTKTKSLPAAFALARGLVAEREQAEGFDPSNPQMAGGSRVLDLLGDQPDPQ